MEGHLKIWSRNLSLLQFASSCLTSTQIDAHLVLQEGVISVKKTATKVKTKLSKSNVVDVRMVIMNHSQFPLSLSLHKLFLYIQCPVHRYFGSFIHLFTQFSINAGPSFWQLDYNSLVLRNDYRRKKQYALDEWWWHSSMWTLHSTRENNFAHPYVRVNKLKDVMQLELSLICHTGHWETCSLIPN